MQYVSQGRKADTFTCWVGIVPIACIFSNPMMLKRIDFFPVLLAKTFCYKTSLFNVYY